MKKLALVCFVLWVAVPGPLCAQDQDQNKDMKFGLTFPEIGVIWHITDNITFMPGFRLSHNWGHSNLTDFDSSSNSVQVYMNLRFYLSEWNKVRFYLSPKYQYSWVRTETESEYSTSTSLHSHGVVGAWGAQYAISDRVGIYGDIGFGYSRGTSSFTITNTVSTEGSWGLILYLK